MRENIKYALQMASIYLGAMALDFASSLHIKPPDEESNPFARHVDGSFWPAHAAINCGVEVVHVLFLSLAAYVLARPLGQRVSRFVLGVPIMYHIYAHLDGAFTNLLLAWPNLYVETQTDILRKLLGQ